MAFAMMNFYSWLMATTLTWGFGPIHRDPDFLVGSQHVLGDSLFEFRFTPPLLGALTVSLSSLIARELKGGQYAQLLAGIAIIISNAMPRVLLMYSNVSFEVFYWVLSTFLLLEVHQQKKR